MTTTTAMATDDYSVEAEVARHGSAKWETLAIPKEVREIVRARDGHTCRLCGQHDESLCAHHILFGGGDGPGMGGRRRHDPETIISLGWSPWHPCHQEVHARKLLWQPLALQAVHTPGVTMRQLLRWQKRREQ